MPGHIPGGRKAVEILSAHGSTMITRYFDMKAKIAPSLMELIIYKNFNRLYPLRIDRVLKPLSQILVVRFDWDDMLTRDALWIGYFASRIIGSGIRNLSFRFYLKPFLRKIIVKDHFGAFYHVL